MIKLLKKYWQLFWFMRKIHLMRMFEYRASFLFWFFVSGVWTVFNFFFFAVMVNVSGNIGGWDQNEMYLLTAVFTIMDAFTWSFFYHNMSEYTEGIFDGRLNLVLTKPVDPQFWIMTHNNNYNNLLRLVIGIGMLFWAVNRLQLQPSWWQIIVFVGLILVSLCFIYFLWFTLSTTSFWFDKLDNINEIIPNSRRTFQVPHQVYQGIISTILTVILPLALISSVPSEVLLNQVSSWPLVIYYIGFTLTLIVISRWFFKVSLKRYSGVAQ